MTLPEFSVRQVVLVNILFFVFLGAGLVAYLRTPVDFFPEIEFNTARIATVWPGASADEIERLVTTRIEDELVDIDGVDEIRSVSRAGVSDINVRFEPSLSDAEFEAGLNDVRAAVDRVADLPEGAEEPILSELNTKTLYADLRVAVVDVGGVGEVALHVIADEVETRLEQVRGVERVTVRGDHEREVRVLVDRDAAERYGLTVVEIAERIRGENLNLPAGSFSGADGESILRATGDFESIEEILGTVVRESPGGVHVRLSDVARVEGGIEKRVAYVRYNGRPALVMGVAKDSASDIVEVSGEVAAFIESYQRYLPQGVELHKTWDTSVWVASRIGVLWDNLLTGVVFVMAILWFTLGFRNAALTIIAIPFSFLTALILFPVMGVTINAMSLVGMLLVSGMLVDDAIIVLENIYRRIEEGDPLRQAVIEGSNEVLWPVVAAVVTTCCAFAPLLLIQGISGKFMEILPITVILCLIASLLECLVILPAHYLEFGSRGSAKPSDAGPPPEVSGKQEPRGVWALYARVAAVARGLADPIERFRGQIDRGMEALRARYLRALDVVLELPKSFVALGAGLCFLSCGVASHLPVDLFPAESNNFFITLEAPRDWGLDQTSELMAGVERELEDMLGDPLTDFFTTVGSAVAGSDDYRIGPHLAVSFAWIVDREEYRRDASAVIRSTQARLDRHAAKHPGEILALYAKPPRNGPPIGRPVAVRILGPDYARTKTLALEMQEYLRTIPGAMNIEDNLREGPREVRLVVDEDRARRHGLAFRDLANSLRGANDGIVASTFRPPAEDREIDIRVLPDERYRTGLQGLLQAPVRAPDGHIVKLGDVAEVEITRGYTELWHFDKQRAVTVYADVDEGRATALGVNQALEARFADVSLRQPEIELRFGGELEATRETVEGMIAALPIALLMIYAVLAAVFRSYLQPFVVATAIPFGFAGVVFGTAVLGYSASMSMMYGTIGLTGVVVNDSLVLVDFINRARARGMSISEAVRLSGVRRLRPILLTTLTTVVALLPMALGLHGGSASFGPFAAAITFGLLFAMFGTLFAVPVVYTLLARAQDRVQGAISGSRPLRVARAPRVVAR